MAVAGHIINPRVHPGQPATACLFADTLVGQSRPMGYPVCTKRGSLLQPAMHPRAALQVDLTYYEVTVL